MRRIMRAGYPTGRAHRSASPDGVRCWVLDARGRPVPPGVPGELYLGGSGVARGYIGTLKAPDAFSANPYQDGATRMYRTGDIVKWRRDGELDYIGRNDFRVKLRGLLVELGEIEHVLMSQPGVRHASALVVDVGAASSVGRQIVGCVIADGFDEPAVLAGAKARLPDYMVPWRLMQFDAFPSNSSGGRPEGAHGTRAGGSSRTPMLGVRRRGGGVVAGTGGLVRAMEDAARPPRSGPARTSSSSAAIRCR